MLRLSVCFSEDRRECISKAHWMTSLGTYLAAHHTYLAAHQQLSRLGAQFNQQFYARSESYEK
ncbi:MAG: hypothetical protein IKV80_05705 [Bacteroidales bacterium]|nr:hypothetical protein [Bacteroidales bacterium]